MKTTTFILSTLLLAGAPLTAQNNKPDTEKLIEQLGDPDYQIRKAAEKKLLGLGEKALEALKRGAEKHDDPEVQWRAGRLARRIQTGDKAAPGGLSKRDRKSKGDVERRERRSGPGAGVEASDEVRKEIERAMEQVRKSLRDVKINGSVDFDPLKGGVRIFDRNFGEGFGKNFSFSSSSSSNSSGRSMKVSSGPDGVRVEIKEKGKEPKVYEAPDMEAFKKKFPDVLKDHRIDFRFGDFPFGGRRMRDSLPKMRRLGADVETDAKTDRKTDRRLENRSSGKKLGFYVADVSPAVRAYLELDESLGLGVESVTDGSLAEKVGLKKGDIVIEVGSRKIYSPTDVAAALDAIGDDPVSVRVIRKGREITLK